MARYTRVSSEQRKEASHFEGLHPEEQRLLIEWIQKYFHPSRHSVMNRFCTAYGLKHMFGNSEFGFYVFSREFAEAMEKAGFQTEQTPWGDWWFNVDPDDVRSAQKDAEELGPVSFGASNPLVRHLVSHSG